MDRDTTEGSGLREPLIYPDSLDAPQTPSPHGIHMFPPEFERVIERIDNLQLVLGEEQIDVLEVSNEQIERIIVVARVDGLREIDNHNVVFNIQHIVGGQIGVNAMLD